MTSRVRSRVHHIVWSHRTVRKANRTSGFRSSEPLRPWSFFGCMNGPSYYWLAYLGGRFGEISSDLHPLFTSFPLHPSARACAHNREGHFRCLSHSESLLSFASEGSPIWKPPSSSRLRLHFANSVPDCETSLISSSVRNLQKLIWRLWLVVSSPSSPPTNSSP